MNDQSHPDPLVEGVFSRCTTRIPTAVPTGYTSDVDDVDGNMDVYGYWKATLEATLEPPGN